jgi:hypothetical protein
MNESEIEFEEAARQKKLTEDLLRRMGWLEESQIETMKAISELKARLMKIERELGEI